MALKDLIADRSKLTEAAIEGIVRDYVRYDPGSYEVVLTPAGLVLSNDAKILALLVAIAGWPYVVDEVRPVDTKPAALERITGIAGGTLRPTLKKLKDAHLVMSTSDGYAVRVANLDAIGRVIAGERAIARPAPRKLKRAAANEDGSKTDVADSSPESRVGKGRRKTGVPIRRSLARLVDNGFFAEERTLGQVVARLHEMAIIAKTTSLSGPIAEMVRGGKLARKKVTDGGKDVWSYRSA
ncbi:hypothetical protein [Mesorhizobium sp.]|uniref:hypothetical protein n=1 Tax=Mesorhizobium sp. TaxID=1871066 RepID=UPI001225B373|nr:hypothetical protein [Mesorhizobium sp.]TIN27659.1 MAG: hypothetical protein E5Y19_10270 [Mesorhizobium sp.]TIN40333.1 MAG: hypothetical protein E5Y13_11075 [Mesorhizobium sp.]TJU90700.1 MAG: hypothetical protein E5Y10_09680 [Mesorhizobium sp.]